MFCDNCGKENAIIAYAKIQETGVEIIRLCTTCAEKKMKEDMQNTKGININMDSFMKDVFSASPVDIDTHEDINCPNCNSSLKDVLKDGVVGCEKCYESFASYIEEIVFNSSKKEEVKDIIKEEIISEKEKERLDLLNKLNVAIELEEYEDAAMFRDKLKSLKEV